MGNWMTVRIVGTCDAKDVAALRAAVAIDDDYANFHCLSYTSAICGLGNWPASSFDVVGNLAERDFSAESVRETLELLGRAAPSLLMQVHCGGDYEDTGCVATVTLSDGKATVGAPEVITTGVLSEDRMHENLLKAISRR